MKKTLSGIFAFLLLVGSFVGINTFFGAHESAAAISDSWQKGISMMPKSSTDFDSDTFKQSLRNLRATGANYVTYVFNYYQTNETSYDIHAGADTPTDQSLADAIDYAHSLGLQVMLKPHVELLDGNWRAYINPPDRLRWFTAFGAMIDHYADLAQAHHVEQICLGTEYIDMASSNVNSTNTQNWINLIQDVRGRFSGKLTYSASWGYQPTDEMNAIQFWPELDYIGLSAYDILNGSNNVQNLEQDWSGIGNAFLKPLSAKYNKPILFTEIGYRSEPNAHLSAWAYLGNGYDATEQANDYTALLEFWSNVPYMQGVQLWLWDTNPNAGGPGDQEYTPQNKPAEAVLKQWFGGSNIIVGKPAFTDATQVSANPSVNQPLTVTVALTNTGDALPSGLADVEIYDSANRKVNQQFFSNQVFNTNNPRTMTVNWTPTSAGNYTVKVGVFTNDWGTAYYWDDGAATFQVTAGQTTPPPPPVNPPTNPTPDNKIVISTSCNAGAPQIKVAWLPGQSTDSYNIDISDQPDINLGLWWFTAPSGATSYTITDFSKFTPYGSVSTVPQMTQGKTYQLRIFDIPVVGGRSYYPVTTFTVPTCSTTPPPPPPSNYVFNIWWPPEGAHITGVQPFKIMIPGLDVSQYTVYWQVDGDVLNKMYDSQTDYPHKESLVDLTNWSWKGAGPYTVNFIAKDLNGNILVQQAVNIFSR